MSDCPSVSLSVTCCQFIVTLVYFSNYGRSHTSFFNDGLKWYGHNVILGEVL